MSEHVTATLNGLPLLALKIELSRGGKASRFEATLPPDAPAPSGAVEIAVADVETRRVFNQFFVTRVETLGDGRVRVHGEDRRSTWQRPVRAKINVPIGDGTAWREGEPLDAQAALDAVFTAAGLPASEAPRLPGGTPAPLNLRESGTLAGAVERLLAQVGLGVTVDDAGEYTVEALDHAAAIDPSRLLERIETRTVAGPITIIGGPALELTELADWECVVPDDTGVLQPIEAVLAAWGVAEAAARRACLSDGGFEALLPVSGEHAAKRLAMLKRYAFPLFRAAGARLPWLPVGGVNDDGTFLPPKLIAKVARPRGMAPSHPAEDTLETTNAEPVEEFELDAQAGTVFVAHPPYALANAGDDPTLQNRAIIGEPRLNLTIAHAAPRPPFTFEQPGEGEPRVIPAPHLVAVYEAGVIVNAAALRKAAAAWAQAQRQAVRSTSRLAGVCEVLATGACHRVWIAAGESGLTTTLEEASAPASPLPQAGPSPEARGKPYAPLPSGLHQPINAFRAGPLVIRTSGETPESEAVLAMEANHRRADTASLELANPGPLAFPYFVPSTDAAKSGRWFFVAGVEVADSGRLRVLAPDNRHAEISADPSLLARHELPSALRGLLVSTGDELRFVDTGPLVSDSRGATPGAGSSLVYDRDGKSLSEIRRGGLQFLSVLALSPAHKSEGCRDGGWAPVLNLREGDTGNAETAGRGLFAEGGGRDLGRLTAKQQGGPVLADGAACTKHMYGMASDDGLYRETAGHISTDAFFKIPGDPVHDAPVRFYAEDFEGGVPPWPPYEAQLKYDPAEKHPWNRALREGRWKIQYRVPFVPEPPPTWTPPIGPPPVPPTDDPPAITVPAMRCLPHDIRPAITENELWAPSHDWVPAPSARDQEREVPYPGPSIKSQGWAGEVDGTPDPSLGGGCIYFPPGVAMPDAQTDSGLRQTFLALHPEVVLAFGHPHFGLGRVHSGWAIELASGHLAVAPRDIDASTPPGMDNGMHVTGHMRVGPVDATFGEAHALRLGERDDEGIAFGEDAAIYRAGPAALRTDGAFEIGGKLTVDGLIDPTGLQLTPQPANPGDGHTFFKTDGSPGSGLAANRPYIGTERIALHSEISAGPGDFTGPAGSVADSIVAFDGATGKLGKQGRFEFGAPGLGAFSSPNDETIRPLADATKGVSALIRARDAGAGNNDGGDVAVTVGAGAGTGVSGTVLIAANGAKPAQVRIGQASVMTQNHGGLRINDLHCTSMVLNEDFTMPGLFAAYLPGPHEIGPGNTLELGADAVFEIG